MSGVKTNGSSSQFELEGGWWVGFPLQRRLVRDKNKEGGWDIVWIYYTVDNFKW